MARDTSGRRRPPPTITEEMWKNIFEIAGDSAGESLAFSKKAAAYLVRKFGRGALGVARTFEIAFKTAAGSLSSGLTEAAMDGLSEGLSDGLRREMDRLLALDEGPRSEEIEKILGDSKRPAKDGAKKADAAPAPPKVGPDVIADRASLYGATALMEKPMGPILATYLEELATSSPDYLALLERCAKHPGFMNRLGRLAVQFRDHRFSMDSALVALVKETRHDMREAVTKEAEVDRLADLSYAERLEETVLKGEGKVGKEFHGAVGVVKRTADRLVASMELPPISDSAYGVGMGPVPQETSRQIARARMRQGS